MSNVPEKYQPEPKRYEEKDWLYQQYWGALKSQHEIAEQTPVSRKKIRMEMAKHGIPTRARECNHEQANPFSGFYNPTEQPPVTENTQCYYDDSIPEYGDHEPHPEKWGNKTLLDTR